MPLPIFCSREKFYKSHFGAAECGTEVTFTLLVPGDFQEYYVAAVITREGYEDFYVKLFFEGEKEGSRIYRGKYLFDTVGTAYYYFKICTQNGDIIVNRGINGFGTLAENVREKFQQTVYKKGFKTPDSYKGGIMYQIFPDRFCSSGKEHEGVPEDRLLRSDWGGTPNFLPDETGRIRNNDYFCGDLEGIISKLSYLKELSVDSVYLNPVFEAHSNHRYNVADYFKIDPLLGTNEDFKRLCLEAKKKGIKIILDGVFSHTGSDSVYFNKEGRYKSIGAYNSPDSPYIGWYKFYDYPNGYKSWWGFTTLPETDEENEDYANFICGPKGVLRYWLELGASGWRLDVADELPDSMLDKIRLAVKQSGEENLIIGEVWEDASNKESYGIRRRYLLGDQLDSVMNYSFKEAILDYVRFCDKNYFIDRIMTIVENYPKEALDVAMNPLSTHDTERAITRLGGESCLNRDRAWQSQHHLSRAEYALGKKRLMLAMVLQYFLPGIPCIYYGDEAGMQGYKDPFNRGCFPWGQMDKELFEHAVKLGRIRKSNPCLAKGKLEFIKTENEVLAFKREDEKGSITILANPTGHEAKYKDIIVPSLGYKII